MSTKKHQKPSSDAPRRTANAVISLTQFAHNKSKGTRRAIENFKQKKTSHFNRNAGLLREYKKVMKNEGFDAGKGASRKRNQDDVTDRTKDQSEETAQRSKKRAKADPFAKAKEKARQGKEDEQTRSREIQAEMKQREKTQKEKKLRAKKLAKRTKKGQPIMKNIIGDMLDRIKADAAK